MDGEAGGGAGGGAGGPAPLAAPLATSLVELKAAAKFYGPRLVFKDVSFAVRPGEIWIVAGENGAGKSTLLRVAAGLSRADAGGVSHGTGPGGIGLLGHETFVYPHLSALENLRFWAKLHERRAAPEDIAAVLARVGLSAAAEERAGRFSRGMAQRLALARVLLLAPELLLLDEPGTGLDARSRAMLEREIAAARERGAGLLWVSHHLGHDLALADKVLFLKRGRAAYCGDASGFAAAEEGLC
ncbi:ABC transporter related protein [Desulfovibrio sp. X2]|nr:ABC transporter related protein [Desulfovibrio sp. X2]